MSTDSSHPVPHDTDIDTWNRRRRQYIVDKNENIMLSFSEAVQVGVGNIEVRDRFQGTLAMEIDASGTNISGENISFAPSSSRAELKSGAEYYVVLGEDAILDTKGRDLQLNTSSSWTFEVAREPEFNESWTNGENCNVTGVSGTAVQSSGSQSFEHVVSEGLSPWSNYQNATMKNVPPIVLGGSYAKLGKQQNLISITLSNETPATNVYIWLPNDDLTNGTKFKDGGSDFVEHLKEKGFQRIATNTSTMLVETFTTTQGQKNHK
jgi:hypothetical protein